MSKASRLRQLLKHPRIWSSGSRDARSHATLPTGFSELDERLGGGWPLGVLTELLLDEEGAGELRMLMPALAQLSHSGPDAGLDADIAERWIAWVAPPYIPYPPALLQHGVNVSRLFVAEARGPRDALWAMEQSLRSVICRAVLGWLTKVDDRAMRRLQLAAEAGNSWAVIFRPARFAAAPSPAPLRIRISAHPEGASLEFLRNRYGAPGSVCLAC